jgi:hypothetical protein
MQRLRRVLDGETDLDAKAPEVDLDNELPPDAYPEPVRVSTPVKGGRPGSKTAASASWPPPPRRRSPLSFIGSRRR